MPKQPDPTPEPLMVVQFDDDYKKLIARGPAAADSASVELLREIAVAALTVVAVGIPTVTPDQRDAVSRLHTLLFGS